MTKRLICTYFLFISVTSAFAITQVINIPLMIAVLLAVVFYTGFITRNVIVSFYKEDFWLIALLGFVVCSLLLNIQVAKSSKPINHTFAYFYTFFISFLTIRWSIVEAWPRFNRDTLAKLSYYLRISVFVASGFGILEFILKVFFFIDFDAYVPHPAVENYEPTVLGEILRVRSFAEESGAFSYFLEVIFPLTLYGFARRSVIAYLYYITVFICFVLTFSSAGFGLMFVILALWGFQSFLKLFGKGLVLSKRVVYFSLLFLLIALVLTPYFLPILEAVLLDKATNSASADDRMFRLMEGLEFFANSPILNQLVGSGPAAYDTYAFISKGMVMLYETFLLEGGILGLLSFCLFVYLVMVKAFRIKDPIYRNSLVISLVCSIIHWLFIATYWYPWFWISVIFVQLIEEKQNDPSW